MRPSPFQPLLCAPAHIGNATEYRVMLQSTPVSLSVEEAAVTGSVTHGRSLEVLRCFRSRNMRISNVKNEGKCLHESDLKPFRGME